MKTVRVHPRIPPRVFPPMNKLTHEQIETVKQAGWLFVGILEGYIGANEDLQDVAWSALKDVAYVLGIPTEEDHMPRCHFCGRRSPELTSTVSGDLCDHCFADYERGDIYSLDEIYDEEAESDDQRETT